MVKKDITAISKVIAAKLCWVAADVENTPCGLLQHKKTWTTTGYSVLSANFPYFHKNWKWQRCQGLSDSAYSAT